MSPSLRNALIAIGAALIACWAGWEIAEGSYVLPLLLALVCVVAVSSRLTGVGANVAFLGVLLVGYLVGNRGFAQLMPAPGLPLLPAELCLLVTVPWMIAQAALARELPMRRDALNWAVLAWMVVGGARVMFDVRGYGLLALRDFATVYYAAFFFVAQHLARDPAARRHLLHAIMIGTIAILPVFLLSEAFPAFFLERLRVLGVPLIYYKGDLVYTFMMVGAVLIFQWADGAARTAGKVFSVVLFLVVASSDSRASLLGGLVAMALLAASRRPRFAVLQGGAMAAAFVALVFVAQLTENSWAERKRDAVIDRLVSVVDVSGVAVYRDAENAFKAGNNQFRLVWWRNVARETWAGNPLLGLGFGYDLARNFVREYSPDALDDFTARSPHSILMTAFGRMGALGLLSLLFVAGALLQVTRRRLRTATAPLEWGVAVAPWVILTSACFGVVLEGPMGAVPFWVLLGLINAEAPDEAAA